MAGGASASSAALGQMGAEVNGAKYYEAAQELRAMGIRDEVVINRYATEMANTELLKEAPRMVLYVVAGKVVGRAAARTLPAGAGAARRAAVGTAGSLVANVSAGTIIKALEQKEGQPLITLESLTTDTLFALFHGVGVGRGARAELKMRAQGELGRREQVVAEGQGAAGELEAQQ